MRRVLLLISCLSFIANTVMPGSAFAETAIHNYLPPDVNFMKPTGRVAVALFDSSETDSREHNGIKMYLEKDLEELGFKVIYHDIQKGLPPSDLMQKTRLVISWYRDPKMKDAADYCHWLARIMRDGKKVILMDNFGAYQDSRSGRWVDMSVVNEVFGELGVLYKANWTSDHEKLSIDYQDEKIVGGASPIDLAQVSHYYLYERSGPLAKDYLRVSRKDLEHSSSSVIFSSPLGGMMLSNYFLVRDPKSGGFKMNVDFKKFVTDSFRTEGSSQAQKALVVWGEGLEKEKSRRTLRNISWTLWYAKIDYDLVEAKDLSDIMVYDLKQYSALIIYIHKFGPLEEELLSKNLKSYVESGRGLLVARHFIGSSLNDLFGIEEAKPGEEVKAEGLRLVDSFLPGAKYMLYLKEDLSSGAFDVRVRKDAQVLGRSLTTSELSPEGIPMVWFHPYGKGRVIYWNADFLSLISLRGVLLYSFLWSQPVAVYSIANIECVQVDDCPQPMYNVRKEPIQSTMDLTDTDFYLNVWWKGMEGLSKKYGLRYTFYTIFNYDAKREPPFDGREFFYGKDGASVELARRILENNFELGFHGYNHQPFVTHSSKYNNWKKMGSIESALGAAKNTWRSVFPDTEEAFSYAAPMNAIDPEGKAAIRKIFPSIRVISTVLDDLEEEGASVMEFGPDKDEPVLFDIPRLTGGYAFSQTVKNHLVSGVSVFGVWTHFMHPDDIFGRYGNSLKQGYADILKQDANGQVWKWEDVLASADALFSFVRTYYPWLRNMSMRDAYHELKEYLGDKRRVEVGEHDALVRFSGGSSKKKFFMIKINNGARVGALENCRLIHTYEDSGVSVFETQWNTAHVKLAG